MQPVVNYDHKTIQVRRGSTTEWRRYGAICIPAEGEICVEFFQDADGSRNGNTGMKVGNGTSNYTDLPYLITNQNQDDRISDDQINNWDLTVEKLANLVASEVGQTNADLGDNVQEALNDLHNRLLAIDPDGGSIEINDIPGLEDALNDKADQSALDKEIQDRKDGDKALQDQIDALDPDGDRTVDWKEIEGKPDKFPPEPHTHDQYLTDETDPVFSASPAASITEEMMADWSDHTDPYDDTQIKADLASETQARIKGDEALAQDITDLEAAVGGVAGQLAFGGSYDANAGVIVKSNLSEFVEGQPLPDYSTVEGKFVIVAVAGDTPEELGEADWLVAGESGWVAIKYGTAGSVLWDNVVGAPDFLTDAQGSIDGDSKQYVRKNGEWTEATGDSPWERNGDDIYYSDGNVGIGTDAPNSTMHLSTTNPRIELTDTDTGASHLINAASAVGNLSIDVDTANNQLNPSFKVNMKGSGALTIDADGNVGIGTSSPSETLEVNGDGRFYRQGGGTTALTLTAASLNSTELTFGSFGGSDNVGKIIGDSASLAMAFNVNAAERMRIDASGNVGIGTDAPNSTMHLSTTNPRIKLTDTDTGASHLINAASDVGNLSIDVDTANNQLNPSFKVNMKGSGALTIDSSGNVGIGMTPLRSTAKEQLAEWKSRFDARLKAEPKADKKAITLEITDDAFEVLPTEEALAEWMETRAAGDKLQVGGQGNISATGKVRAEQPSEFGRPPGLWSSSGWYGISNYGALYTGGGFGVSLVSNGYRNNSGPNGTWTSLNVNGNTGAAEVRLLPNGKIEFLQDADKADGSANTPNLRTTFDANGDATFSGTVTADKTVSGDLRADKITVPVSTQGRDNVVVSAGHIMVQQIDPDMHVFTGQTEFNNLGVTSSISARGDAYFQGTVSDGSGPLVSTASLIETLSTLRNATKDETTLEGLRDAIGNAVGGLIEKFEAMQSVATQEIAE